jgi:formamidopyrimidine-DNA glycosylase
MYFKKYWREFFMPELPEVECLTRAVRRVLKGSTVEKVEFLRKDLRDPIPIRPFKAMFEGQIVDDVFRRSKYMLWQASDGLGIIHLGMTGNLVYQETDKPILPHTHMIVSLRTKTNKQRFLHYIDARRFGRISCMQGHDYEEHAYFNALGPEPLLMKDLGQYLWEKSRRRKGPIKPFLMDAKTVVGVGNIYASESLFRAGIHPARAAGRVSQDRYIELGGHIKATLSDAISQGGTTFRDFKNANGNPGYFRVSLAVYDRERQPCRVCGTPIKALRQAGRSTFFCGVCQR